jgi:hypothetical protein
VASKSGIKIKPGNKGKLHKDLGVPSGKPIPAAKLAQAKASSDPAERKRATFAENAKSWHHGSPGKVSSIDAHPDGKSATVRITHGKKKRDRGGELQGYHQQSSSVTVPKAHAQNYVVGQKVHAGLSAAGDNDVNDTDGDEAGEVDETQNAPTAPTPLAAAKKKPAAKGKPKKKAAKAAKKGIPAPPPPSPIRKAMATGMGGY